VTIRQAQALGQIANASRMELWLDVTDEKAVASLAQIMTGHRGGRSEVFLRVPTASESLAHIFIGDDFSIDADLAEAIATVPGTAIHRFDPMPPGKDSYRVRSRRSQMHSVSTMRAAG
jgi:DNA polymerase-3 subunit alpha